jgi:hypothetical protein
VRATAGGLTRRLGRWLHGQRRRRADSASTEDYGAARSGTNHSHGIGARADLSHCWGRNLSFRRAAGTTGGGSTRWLGRVRSLASSGRGCGHNAGRLRPSFSHRQCQRDGGWLGSALSANGHSSGPAFGNGGRCGLRSGSTRSRWRVCNGGRRGRSVSTWAVSGCVRSGHSGEASRTDIDVGSHNNSGNGHRLRAGAGSGG